MFAFAPRPMPAVPVWGERDVYFPVRRVYCVGFNYARHNAEMQRDARKPPVIFSKPADAGMPVREREVIEIPYPSQTSALHHEVELVVAVGKGGADLAPEQAADCIWGWSVAVDLTRRDLQNEARAAGNPWDACKGFDCSCPIAMIRPKDTCLEPSAAEIWLHVGDKRVQAGNTGDMIWKPAEILSEISKFWRLEPGDLVLTGTPAGVGPLVRGDVVTAGLGGVGTLKFRVA